jgi:serpin B
MRMAFQPGEADFSGLGGARAFFIDAVFHKALVEVNEAGAEAAAATAVVMGRSVPMRPTFKADRPFIFLIRNNTTGSILFMGRVMEPLE